MSSIINEYNNICKKRATVVKEINKLKENDAVKRYIELVSLNKSIKEEQKNIYNEMQMENYTNCNHILVYTKEKYDYNTDNYYKCCGCIKCGLDNEVLDYPKDELNNDKLIMYNYLKKKYITSGTLNSHVMCDLDLACAIYRKIKNKYPDIDDKLALKYFEIALDNMENIPVNESRLESRAKRLSLSIDKLK